MSPNTSPEEVSVDFLLGRAVSSRLIAWFGLGFGGFSHAASVLKDGRYLDARDDTIKGVPPGVHIREPSTEKCVKRFRCTVPIPAGSYDAWEANLRAKIGTPYAEASIWAFITGRKTDVHGMWDCSMLAINALQHIRVFPLLSVPAHQISPNTLLLMMEGIGGRTQEMEPFT